MPDRPKICGEHTAHYWIVTNTQDVNNIFMYHHECQRCGAQKDIPLENTHGGIKWPGSKTPQKIKE